MDYLAKFHSPSVDWTCDSDICQISRQLEQESGGETTRGEKPRKQKFEISQAPEVLCIQLKRSQFERYKDGFREIKIKDHVPYPEELELDEFNKEEAPLRYRLYGVVAHSGATATSGHYIAAVRTRNDSYMTISDSNMQTDNAGTWDELRSPSWNDENFDPVLLFYLKL